MQRSKMKFLFAVWLAVIMIACVMNEAFSAAQQAKKTWSFNFKNCSYPDALDQISQKTGIKILTKGKINYGPFSKSFKHQTIDKILDDLFRRKSHAIRWRYSENGLVSIDIWIIGKDESRSGFDPSIFKKYKAPIVKAGLKKKNQRIAVSRTQGVVDNDKKRYASFDVAPKRHKLQSEKVASSPGNKLVGGGSRRIPQNLEENVSNQDEQQAAIWPQSPEGSAGQKGNVPDTTTNDNGGDETNSGPPAPPTDKNPGLEPPPMPPGFSSN